MNEYRLLEEVETSQTLKIIMQVVSMVVILLIGICFGMLPYFWKSCKGSILMTGLSNAFSSGIFLGISIFHLLPEASEGFKNYFEKNKIENLASRMPLSYILVFCAFSLILFIEKVAFDSHSIIEHEHGDGGHGHGHGHGHDHGDHKDDEDNEEDEEEVMKNLVSSTKRAGSFIMENNLSKLLIKIERQLTKNLLIKTC